MRPRIILPRCLREEYLLSRIACRHLVSGSFHYPFGYLFHLSLTVLVRYRSWGVFIVGSWFSRLHAPVKVRYSWTLLRTSLFLPTGVSPCSPPRSRGLRQLKRKVQRGQIHIAYTLPHMLQIAIFPFRSPLLRESLLLSSPAGTKMFQFPAFLLPKEQFGNPRFKGCMRLPWAYRSLPRPSSAPKPRHPPSGLLRFCHY